jgi:hypothetical protein
MSGFKGRLEFLVDPPDSDLLACEADVLGERYGDTAESLEQAYGAYADRTAWLSVRNDDQVIGWGRLIVPGPVLPKTLVDFSRDPWNLDAGVAVAKVGLDPQSCMDIATIGARSDLGSDGARVAAALYHGIVMGTRVNEIEWVVAVLHVLVRRVLASAGLVMHALPGARPAVYMDAPGFLPVYANMNQVLSEQRRVNPEAYRQVVVGEIPGISVPEPETFLLPLTEVDLRGAETSTAPRVTAETTRRSAY